MCLTLQASTRIAAFSTGLTRDTKAEESNGSIGLAANGWSDIPLAAAAVTARQVLGLIYRRWQHSAPEYWPPPLTYGEMKALSARVLPGVRYRRHLLGRYSLVWRKPQRSSVAA